MDSPTGLAKQGVLKPRCAISNRQKLLAYLDFLDGELSKAFESSQEVPDENDNN